MMDNTDIKEICIANSTYKIPPYYSEIPVLPEDPEGAVPFAVKTPYSNCFFIGYEISKDQMIPTNQEALISGIRKFLADNQGIIECEASENVSYSIIKTLNEPSGVQYTLSFQEVFEDKIVFIQGSFEETGTTGLRDNIVLSEMLKSNMVGTSENPFEGWTMDPYDKTVTNGALMNLSELRQFDKDFSGTPLMVCRELVDCLIRTRYS